MIGLSEVKEIIRKIIAMSKLNKMYTDCGMSKENPSLHMAFTGNPGTAKTTVARLFARILRDEKILLTGNFVEVGRADLVGKYVGHTAPLVKKKFKQAQGGVLFIDEAYSLCDGMENGYGDEAINTIVQEMENHRNDVVAIFAGYPDKMSEFIKRNPGMASRIKFNINFPDYTTDELCAITKLMLKTKQMQITNSALEKLREIYENALRDKQFGNGRFARKMLEDAQMNLAVRVVNLQDPTRKTLTTIEADDIPNACEFANDFEKKRIGF